MISILLATTNPGKRKEYQEILKNYKLILPAQVSSLPPNFSVQETGRSFKENASLKAIAYGQRSGLLTLADDSGLVIDYLHGWPGIHSARFAQGDYIHANQKILKLLSGLPIKKRKAHFEICLALFNPLNSSVNTFTAKAHGWINDRPLGNHGFGYDPIFFSQQLKLTFAQISQAQKNHISHRAKAVKKLISFLSQSPIGQQQ